MAVSVLIPALQPGEGMLGVVAALAEDSRVRHVWVVDDGSGPEFEDRFRRTEEISPKVRMLRHEMNLGKGVALRTGINAFQTDHLPGEVLVTADADGQHLPEDILNVATHALKHPQALVLGVRAFGEGTPLRSQFGNSLTKLVFRLLTGISLRDTQTGLRAVPPVLMPKLMRLDSRRYQFELEMLLTAFASRTPMETVPIQTVYLDHNAASHFNPMVDSVRIYWVFVRFLLFYLLPWLVDLAVFLAALSQGVPLGVALLLGKVSMPVVRSLQARLGEPDGLGRDPTFSLRTWFRVLGATLLSAVLVYAGMKILGSGAAVAKLVAELAVGTVMVLSFRWRRKRGPAF